MNDRVLNTVGYAELNRLRTENCILKAKLIGQMGINSTLTQELELSQVNCEKHYLQAVIYRMKLNDN